MSTVEEMKHHINQLENELIRLQENGGDDLRLFRALADNAPDAIGIADMDGNVEYMNSAYRELIGCGDEALGQSVATHIPPEDVETVLPQLMQSVQQGGSRGEMRVQNMQGQIIDVYASVFAVMDSVGQPYKIANIMRDISEKKAIDADLREKTRQLAEALETAQLGQWEFDVANQLFHLTDEFYNVLGTTATEQSGYKMLAQDYIADFVHPEDASHLGTEIQKTITSDDYVSWIEYRIRHADQSFRNVIVRIHEVTRSAGSPIATWIRGSIQDITPQKETEHALRANESKLNDALAIAKLAPWEFDVATMSFTMSDQFLDILGTSADEQGGYLMTAETFTRQFVHPDDRTVVDEEVGNALAANDPQYTGETSHRIVRSDGSERYLSVYIRNETDYTGKLVKLSGVVQDITEQRQKDEERERLQHEVIEAQKHALQELSTPIIPLMEGIIILPLIGTIDTQRSRDIMRNLLAGISQHRAKVVILDITGVPVVDTGVADHLNKTVQASRLKGTRTIITGISDAIAETIVDLGIDWSSVETLRDLQTGLAHAMQIMGIESIGH